MAKTLANKSGFFKEKAKFFLFRGFSYFSFLMLPIYLQEAHESGVIVHLAGLLIYNLFMISQWYFLGKEIDYRLKIYIEVNSSIDRIIERTLLGFILMVLWFNIISLLGESSLGIAFWGTWIITGLFYSWPTRGKIIHETIAGQMKEFRYLDAFSKTTLFCSIMMFVFSIPDLPLFSNIEAFKLYIDPLEKVHPYLWNFTYVNFFPFIANERIFSLAWSLNLYFWGGGLLLISFYAITRYLVSRRLALLATFGLISSWSFVLILQENYFDLFNQMFIIVWLWSILLVAKSNVYRSGFIFGLVNFLGVILNPIYIFLFIFGGIFIYFEVLKDRNPWFKKQFFKYSSFGIVLSLITLKTNHGYELNFNPWDLKEFLQLNIDLIHRKAFFALAIFGLIPLVAMSFKPLNRYTRYFEINTKPLFYLMIPLLFCLSLSFCFHQDFLKNFSLMCIYPIFSIIALEWIFQSMRRFRSRRNLIYSVYFLICLLDSHFELRMASVINFFSSESFMEFLAQL